MKTRTLVNLDIRDNVLVADARNILFNYLFVRHHHGQLFFRIDDLAEPPPASDANALATLAWLGLGFDAIEGEETKPHLRLSERKDLYAEFARRLIDQNLAYPCFCSRDTLREMFTQQKIHGQTPHYDGRCLRMSQADRREQLAAGRPHQVRLRTPDLVSEVLDLVRGKLVFAPQEVTDLVVMQYNQVPTTALANVVDHHVLGISHVVRGDRFKALTPREAFLRQAFGFKSPEYAHIPLILGEDRSLLSERHGDKCIEDFRAKGYLPDALTNYLAAQGRDIETQDQLRSLGTLTRSFRLEDISHQPTVWKLDALQGLNRIAIEKIKDDALVQMVAPYVKETGHDLLAQGDAWARAFVSAIRPGLKTLSDAKDSVEVYFEERFVPDKKGQNLLKEADAKKIVEAMDEMLEDMAEVSSDNYVQLLDAGRQQATNKSKALAIIRVALTGRDVGPEFSKLLPLLGKKMLSARLDNARRYIPRGMKRDNS